jgi:periplasmic divalent cation tolerance protein
VKPAIRFSIVLVTAPDLKTARRLARAALEARLAACANLIAGLQSHYWWRGKIETAGEVLILFKTRETSLRALERLILAGHPYETPEFIALRLTAGTERYLQWLGGEISGGNRTRGRRNLPVNPPRKERAPTRKSS